MVRIGTTIITISDNPDCIQNFLQEYNESSTKTNDDDKTTIMTINSILAKQYNCQKLS